MIFSQKATQTTIQPEQPECVTYYETEGHARKVCFVLGNGDRVLLNYAFLVSGEYEREKVVPYCHSQLIR